MKRIKIISVCLACIMLLSACMPTQVSQQLRLLERGGDDAIAATNWLLENQAEALPVLINLLDSPREERIALAQKGLIVLDQTAVDYIIANFNDFNGNQQAHSMPVLAANPTRERIMTILFFMSYPAARESVIQAISQTGQQGAEILLSLIDNPQLKHQVSACFAAFDTETAAAALLPLLQSENTAQALRAQAMLMELGESAAAALVDFALHTDKISASLMALLMDNPQTVITGIAGHQCSHEGCVGRAAALLASFPPDLATDILTSLAVENTQAAQVCSAYALSLGVDGVMTAILTDSITDQTVLTIIGGSFSETQQQEGLARYMLRNFSHPNAVEICSALLQDERSLRAVEALTTNQAAGLGTYMAALAEDDLAWFGGFMSSAAQVPSLAQEILQALPGAGDALYPRALEVAAYVTHEDFGKLVLGELGSADEASRSSAITALLNACTDGSKFAYGALDYTPFADSIIAFLAAEDTETKTLGQTLLKCIPETPANYPFFSAIFQKQPSQAVFQQLQASYQSEGGLNVQYSDGSSEAIKSLIVKINPNWQTVPAQDRPDTKRQLSDVLGYMGIEITSAGAPTLESTFTISPQSKVYPGLYSRSYTGSQTQYTLKLTSADGSKSATVTGTYTIDMPEKLEGLPAGTYAYMSDPLDGPNLMCLKQAYVQAMYQMFGIDALIMIIQQDGEMMEVIEKTAMKQTPPATE